MTVVEYDGRIVVVDTGLMFPAPDQLGIDLVLPDFAYIRERADDVEAIVLTHGHEDHVGALPYVLRELAASHTPPVYGGPLTIELVRSKLDEHRLLEVAQLGRDGLLLLCGDSTNVDRPGIAPSESSVGPHLEEAFTRCEGRIVVTSFASNIHRVQQVVDAAATVGRKVSLVGRSMRKNTNIGRNLGHIEIPEGMQVGVKEIEDFPDHKVVVISTGSQGEPLSALRRMAHGDHPNVDLRAGDTVIFSATPIPGNERAVNETINRIYQLGANVLIARDAPIHASGHGYAEEMKMMINLTRPRNVMPFHGDHRRMRLHGQLAESVGVPAEAVFHAANGRPLEIDSRGARLGAREQAGMIFVDGVDVGDPEDIALRDRRMLSADGIFIVVATVSGDDGRSVAPPELIFRGVPFIEGSPQLLDEIRDAVDESLARSAEEEVREISLLQDHLHDDIARFVYERLRRRPMVLPVVVEV